MWVGIKKGDPQWIPDSQHEKDYTSIIDSFSLVLKKPFGTFFITKWTNGGR